jgi:methionyl aminopeptidase
LNDLAETMSEEYGATPAFKGYKGFPYSICASLNTEVVHGFPSNRPLKTGDILSIDYGALLDGYYGDAAFTIPIGRVTRNADRLLRTVESALYKGIYQAKPGNNISDISRAIENYVNRKGYSPVRDFTGHGLGRHLHEKPAIPNFTGNSKGIMIKPGMVLAIEPMANEKKPEILLMKNKWTAVTKDGKLSAHFEHTIVVTEDGPEILTLDK